MKPMALSQAFPAQVTSMDKIRFHTIITTGSASVNAITNKKCLSTINKICYNAKALPTAKLHRRTTIMKLRKAAHQGGFPLP